jgi:hypothetical protein
VKNEVFEGYGFSEVGDFRQVLADIVVQGKLPPAGQEGGGEGRELLGDRSHVENGGRHDRDVVFELGASVAALVDYLAGLQDSQGSAGRIPLIPFGEDLVDLRLQRLRDGWRCIRRFDLGQAWKVSLDTKEIRVFLHQASSSIVLSQFTLSDIRGGPLGNVPIREAS